MEDLTADGIGAAVLDLEQARSRFHAIRRMPFMYRPAFIVLAQGFLSVGVAMLFGASWVIAAIAFLAACSAAMRGASGPYR